MVDLCLEGNKNPQQEWRRSGLRFFMLSDDGVLVISGVLRVESWKKNPERNKFSLRDMGLNWLMKLKKIWNLWDLICLMGLFVVEKYEFEWWIEKKIFCYEGWTWWRCTIEDEDL